MTAFRDTYLGRLRQRIGHDLVILPGVQVIVMRDDGRVLVQRRTDSGEWEFPSGACEPGQTFAEAAVVELREEAGIQVDAGRLEAFATTSDALVQTIHYPNGDVVQAYALCFLVRLEPGEDPWASGLDGEAWAHGWVRLESLPGPMIPSCERAAALLRGYVEDGVFRAS